MTKVILVADDCEMLRWATSRTLKKAGYEVIEACDGKDALSKLDERQIHLVVSDLNMPQMDGISLLKAIGRSTVHESIPVIIYSSDIRDEKIKEGLAAGASWWLPKPTHPAQMLALVSQLLDEGKAGMCEPGKSSLASTEARQQ